MQTDKSLLRIYMTEGDMHHTKPLYEEIIQRAFHFRLAGATITRGQMGFGKRHHMHSSKILRLSENLPVVIDIVDTKELCKNFIESIAELSVCCLITIVPITVIQP